MERAVHQRRIGPGPARSLGPRTAASRKRAWVAAVRQREAIRTQAGIGARARSGAQRIPT